MPPVEEDRLGGGVQHARADGEQESPCEKERHAARRGGDEQDAANDAAAAEADEQPARDAL